MLLYLVVKNHSFVDGIKRIADVTIVAITIMLAVTSQDEMFTMVKVVVRVIS